MKSVTSLYVRNVDGAFEIMKKNENGNKWHKNKERLFLECNDTINGNRS